MSFQNSVFSFIIGKDSKIGYVKIPSFYADLDGNSRKGCADDVAREVIKLQRDSIQGLVIDLIDNGGGSMEEAIKLAGMFIDYGPLSIVVDHTKEKSVINDLLKGIIYRGPIVVLVNSNTASASELVINGLRSYIDVIQIGDATAGKNVGSVTVYDSPTFRKQNVNPAHKYAMQPIVLKIANKDDFSDYTEGLPATVEQLEDIGNLGVIGQTSDPLLNTALSYILTNGRIRIHEPEKTFQHFEDSKSMRRFGTEMYLE